MHLTLPSHHRRTSQMYCLFPSMVVLYIQAALATLQSIYGLTILNCYWLDILLIKKSQTSTSAVQEQSNIIFWSMESQHPDPQYTPTKSRRIVLLSGFILLAD